MAYENVRLGIIGCGALGVVHAGRFAGIEGVRVEALSDPSQEAMERAAAKCTDAKCVGAKPRQLADYRALLDLGLDAVCIASPDGFHVEQVMDSLGAGCHVHCEKPLTPDPASLEMVIGAAKVARKHVAMTYPRRYDASIRAMRKEILSGRWGRVTIITAYNCEDWITPNAGTWRHDPEITPGGFFYDASGHQIDTIMWATGLEAVSVSAKTDNRGSRIPLVAWGCAELTGEADMTFAFVGDAHAWREQVNIHCEGTDFAILNGKAHQLIDGKMSLLGQGAAEETGDEAFIKLLRGTGPNWAPPEELWPVLRFTRAALASAQSGSPESAIQERK